MGDLFEDWSGSETPPLSDEESNFQLLVVTAEDKLLGISKGHAMVGFSCSCAEGQSATSQSYLKSGFIERVLMSLDPVRERFNNFFIWVCRCKYVTKEILMAENCQRIFLSLRQLLFRLLRYAKEGHANSQVINEIRDNVTCILALVTASVYRSNPLQAHTVNLVMNEFAMLLRAIGRLSEGHLSPWLRSLRSNRLGRSTVSAEQVLIHIHLDVHVAYLCFLARACLLENGPAQQSSKWKDAFNEQCLKLLWDLSAIANLIWSMSAAAGSADMCPFPCPCFKEMWLIILHVCDYLSRTTGCKAFWATTAQVLQGVAEITFGSELSRSSNGLPRVSWTSNITFCWWLLGDIAKLYYIDKFGMERMDSKTGVPGNWMLVQNLLKSTLLKPSNEAEVKYAMQSCMSLTRIWSPDLGACLLLWDHVHKKMNEGDGTKRDGNLSNYLVHEFTSVQLTEMCVLCCAPHTSDRIHIGSAFLHFVHLLCVTLKRMQELDDEHLSQLKGRIFTKFHKKRMEELNEEGIRNFVLLFTSLALSGKSAEVIQKMISYMSLLQLETKSLYIRKIIMKGLFGSYLACKSQILLPGASHVAEKLQQVVKIVSNDFLSNRADKEVSHGLWDLLVTYLSEVEAVLDQGCLIGSDADLIFLSLDDLKGVCTDQQMRKLLAHCSALLTAIRAAPCGDSLAAVCVALHSRVYEPLCGIALQGSYNEKFSDELALFLAGFSLLAIEKGLNAPDVCGGVQIDEIIQKFVLNSQLSRSFSCRYASHVLSSHDGRLAVESTGSQGKLVKLWIDSVIEAPVEASYVQELTRSIRHLSDVSPYVTLQECTLPEHVEAILSQFIAGVGKAFSSLTNLADVIQFRKKFIELFSDVAKLAEPFIVAGSPQESVRRIMSVCGRLVHHCAKLIYVKTQPKCLLPQLLDLLVLPLHQMKKPTPPAVIVTLKSYLHLFLHGLSTLDFRKDEFVARKIRDIFQKYFIDLTSVCYLNHSAKNPFLIAMKETLSLTPSEQARDFRLLVMEIVRDNFLQLPQPSQQLASVLFYLCHLLEKTQCEELIRQSSPLLLSKMLACVMLCDAAAPIKGEPPAIRRQASSVLKILVGTAQTDASALQQLREELKNFVAANLPTYQAVALKSLYLVVSLNPDLVEEILPDVRGMVQREEVRRGVGRDQLLQKALEDLTCQVMSLAAGRGKACA